MKNLKYIFILAISFSFLTVNAQEKKIEFSKGTLKICSTKNFKVEGYNGTEVIIKSLHDKKNIRLYKSPSRYPAVRKLRGTVSSSRIYSYSTSNKDSLPRVISFFGNNEERKKGLKRLGKKQENIDYGIYFIIEEKDGELIFKDNTDEQFAIFGNESYSIKIPNSIKLNWDTSGCNKNDNKSRVFYSSKASSLSDFNGEVEISTSLNNFKIKDVTGPVSMNSIGGNVTIMFDKTTPKKLYSVYSNNGFIDVTFPLNSDVTVDANSSSVFSDIDFNVLEDKEEEGLQKMKLKLKSGKVKMKLNAGLGNIYLRKK